MNHPLTHQRTHPLTHAAASSRRQRRRLRPVPRQRGLSLITTLLFMVSALMLGVSVLSVNVMQEKVIGNTKDRDLAFQAAEAALRDGEEDLVRKLPAGSVFSPTCAAGLCLPPARRAEALSVPAHEVAGFDWTNLGQVRMYGAYTGATRFPGVYGEGQPVGQPRYVIEQLGYVGTASGERSEVLGSDPGQRPAVAYRITARGTGAREETVVVLQSIYTKP